MSTDFAPSIVVSRSGLDIAWRAASVARFSPDPKPIPIWAIPLSRMTVRTSAKSRLMRLGIAMRSDIPCIPGAARRLRPESIHQRGAFAHHLRSRSLGMTTSVSTRLSSSLMPFSALPRAASLEGKGLGHDANRQYAYLRATSATTARHRCRYLRPFRRNKHKVCTLRFCAISSRLSSAAFWPISGRTGAQTLCDFPRFESSGCAG